MLVVVSAAPFAVPWTAACLDPTADPYRPSFSCRRTPGLVLADTALPTSARAKFPAATRFRDLALNRCHAFLPDQEGAGGWCCGRPVEGGDRFLAESYCAQHSVRFRVQARR